MISHLFVALPIFINDVGQGTWEEINEGLKNADYGWSVREGHCAAGSGATTNCGAPPAGMTNPIADYQHGPPNNCTAITGGAFVPAGIWPAEYDGVYLFGDYGCRRIFTLTSNGAGGSPPCCSSARRCQSPRSLPRRCPPASNRRR